MAYCWRDLSVRWQLKLSFHCNMAAITVSTPWLQNFTASAVEPEVAWGGHLNSNNTPSPAINKGVFCTLWGNTLLYDLNFLQSSCAKYTLKGYAWHALLWPVPEAGKKRLSRSICDVKRDTNYVFTSWPADLNPIVERTSLYNNLLKKSRDMTLCVWACTSVLSPEDKDLYGGSA
jgi:hypothetical protein